MPGLIFRIIEKFKIFFFENNEDSSPYHIETYTVDSTGRVFIKIHVKNSMTVITKPVQAIYNDSDFLSGFTKKQAAFIGILYATEKSGKIENLKEVGIKNLRQHKFLTLISMLFISIILLSNTISQKVVVAFGLPFIVSSIFFPFVYLAAALITEVYGYREMRRIIWGALACNLVFMLGVSAASVLPKAPYWHLQAQYRDIVGSIPRQIIGCMLAFFFAQFFNSYALARLKVYMHGKYLWLRCLTSSSLCIIIDSTVFCIIAYLWVVSTMQLESLILNQIFIQIIFVMLGSQLLVVPFARWLKKEEQVDYYDSQTKFTPFSLKLVD